MSECLPSIGVVTTNTDSASRGYPAFFASASSWARWADQTIIVDGGTLDDTYERLADWVDPSRYEVFASPETYWDTNGCWHEAQWGINMRLGLGRLRTDWAFIVTGDLVLDPPPIDDVRRELAANRDQLGVRFHRRRFVIGSDALRHDTKWYALNLALMRRGAVEMGWGLDRDAGRLSDEPLRVELTTLFTDPITSVAKWDFAGRRIPIDRVIRLSSWSYGFFFYSLREAVEHMREFHTIFATRYMKRYPRSDRWHLRRLNLDRIVRYRSLEEERARDHPPPVQRLLLEHYQEDMIGTAVVEPPRGREVAEATWGRIRDGIKTVLFHRHRFPSLFESQRWYPPGESGPPLDTRALYEEQDQYLPAVMRARWTAAERRYERWLQRQVLPR